MTNKPPKKHEPNPALGITPEHAAQLDAAADRTEQGLPTEIGVVRSATALEDALQMLQEESQETEET